MPKCHRCLASGDRHKVLRWRPDGGRTPTDTRGPEGGLGNVFFRRRGAWGRPKTRTHNRSPGRSGRCAGRPPQVRLRAPPQWESERGQGSGKGLRKPGHQKPLDRGFGPDDTGSPPPRPGPRGTTGRQPVDGEGPAHTPPGAYPLAHRACRSSLRFVALDSVRYSGSGAVRSPRLGAAVLTSNGNVGVPRPPPVPLPYAHGRGRPVMPLSLGPAAGAHTSAELWLDTNR